MKKMSLIPLTGLLLLGVSLVGYLIADIFDIAPGVLTVKPPVSMINQKITYQLKAMEPENTGEFALPNGNLPDKSQIKAVFDELDRKVATATIEGKTVPTGARVGAVVLNSKTGQSLLAKNSATPMTAASSTKILAAVTALTELGPEYRFETAVFQEDNKITLVAGGDIALGIGSSNPSLIYGRAGIDSLAQQTAQKLKEQGLKTVSLEFDNSLFGDSHMLPAWVESEVKGYTMAPTAIAINGGVVPDQGEYDYYIDPPNVVLQQFIARLKEKGIAVVSFSQVTNKSLEQQVFPIKGQEKKAVKVKKLASVKGAELWELLYRTLKYSDNAMADAVCRAATVKSGLAGSFPNQVETVKNNLEKLKVKTDGLQIQDCSGLSNQGKISPQLLADTIQTIAKQDNEKLRSLYSDMPRASFDGTLQKRMDGTPAVGKVWAKTGSLSQAKSISGFVETKSGALLTVVVIIDSYQPDFDGAIRDQLDSAMAQLAGL